MVHLNGEDRYLLWLSTPMNTPTANATVTQIAPGSPMRLCITAENTYGEDAYLTAWIDWNGNGVLEAGEQVVNATVATGGLYNNCFTVIVPNTSVRDQDLGIRIRLNLNAPAGPTGLAVGGEVEDYMVRIICPPEICGEGTGTR